VFLGGSRFLSSKDSDRSFCLGSTGLKLGSNCSKIESSSLLIVVEGEEEKEEEEEEEEGLEPCLILCLRRKVKARTAETDIRARKRARLKPLLLPSFNRFLLLKAIDKMKIFDWFNYCNWCPQLVLNQRSQPSQFEIGTREEAAMK
jgi:hypothetical protein